MHSESDVDPCVLITHDGVRLALRAWAAPSADKPRGTVLIVHGLGEHIGRYAHVAAALNAIGLGVVGYDQRGHGRSGGPRGVLPERDDLLRDLALVIDAVRQAQPGPLVLLGHSMGGLVAARFASGVLESPRPAWAREVDALVLSSPALDPGMSGLQRLLARVGDALAPRSAIGNGLAPDGVSRDPAVVAAYVADPLVHDRISPRLARFIADEGRVVQALVPRWRTPTLVLWAGADRFVAPRGSEAFVAAAPAGVVQGRAFPGLFHEIFNEPEQREVLSALAAWLDKLTSLPRKATSP